MRAWHWYGENDPYFGVLSHERFSGKDIDREEFFRSGEEYVRRLWSWIETVRPGFAPRDALDFGCGVGRLLRPLSQRTKVSGVDISPAMLLEAGKNCPAAKLYGSVDDVQQFDFIHSYIVFQHIPVREGLRLARKLVDRLRPDGIGVLHFTYARRASWLRMAAAELRKFPLLNRISGRPAMQMNRYPVNKLLRILQESGCHRVSLRFSDHVGHLGLMILFEKTSDQPF